jgi:long-chain fatty acid transport protein
MKLRKLFVAITVGLMFSTTIFANGLSLNSVGTKALGMGGAFIGLANDGSAIFWNPAGLIGQKSAVMVYYTGIVPTATYKLDAYNIDAKTNSKIYHAPGLFANYSTGNWAFGLGIFVPAGLGTNWNAEDFYGPNAADKEMLSEIGVISISPSVAYKVSDKFSVGLTFNVFYGMFDIKQPVDGGQLGMYQFSESSSGTGYGVTLGLKYDISSNLSAGLSFRTKTVVAMSGDATNPMFPNIPNNPPTMMPGPEKSSFSRDVTWPTWIGFGLAYKPNNKLTLTFDAQYSKWSEDDKFVAEYDDAYWKQVMESSGGNVFELKWEDQIQYRVGAEYLATPCLAVRLGYYYDPAPAPDETVNVLFPSSTNNVATFGLGYAKNNIVINAGAEYYFGSERNIEMNPNYQQPGVHQMDMLTFSVGFGYKL